MSTKITRRRFLTAMSAGATWIALTSVPGCKTAERATKNTPSTTASPPQPEHVLASNSSPGPPQGAWVFHTRPDLSPPAVDVTTPAHDTAPGYVLASPE